jgi:septum site-determining protein MinC
MSQAYESGIQVRGTRDGVAISMGDGLWEDLLAGLAERLHATGSFFAGSRVTLDVGDRDLTEEQLAQLEDVLNRYDMGLYAIAANSADTRSSSRAIGVRAVAASLQQTGTGTAPAAATEAETGNALLVRRTIRSGQVIEHSGNLVIVGDVNPGGEVIAGGDVIIWGRLRGVVHAGAVGKESAIVCALFMRPMQLRIGDHIARAPEEGPGAGPISPEVAMVSGGDIVLMPWTQG